MLRHDTGGFAATTAPEGFGLEDFVNAGIRAIERRFKAKDTIVMSELQREGVIEVQNRKTVLVDKEALAKHASGSSGLSADGQISI